MEYGSAQNGKVIAIQNLVKQYDDITAVNRLNLEIRKGEMFGFLGPNGAGKTTTISMLCGLVEPTAGTARIAGWTSARIWPGSKKRSGCARRKPRSSSF